MPENTTNRQPISATTPTSKNPQETKPQKTGDQAPTGAKHKDTKEEETSTETKKKKETQEAHSYTQ